MLTNIFINMKIDIYNYLFYKVYVFTRKLGKYDVAFSTMIAISFLLIVNVSLAFIHLLSINKDNYNLFQIPMLIFGFAVLTTNYFLFIYKDKYKIIIEKYHNESLKKGRWGSAIVILYVMLTFLSIFI